MHEHACCPPHLKHAHLNEQLSTVDGYLTKTVQSEAASVVAHKSDVVSC